MLQTHLQTLKSLRRDFDTNDVKAMLDFLGAAPSIPLLEKVVSYYKAKEQAIVSKDLMEDLEEEGLTSFETDEFAGKIKLSVSASIKDKVKGSQWLIDNGYSDLIKEELKFPKGELDEDAISYLSEHGYSFERDSKVHPQTLKKVISDRINAGEELPDDTIINVNMFEYVEVKNKK